MHHLRQVVVIVTLAACGNSPHTPDGLVVDSADHDGASCQSVGAIGQTTRRAGNPRIIAGHQFSDGKLDISISDPDVHREAGLWHLYYMAAHATTFSEVNPPQLIRHATSADRMVWSIDDAPALLPASDPSAWDHLNSETPTVVMDPAAPPDRRYLMLYSGANGLFPQPGYTFPNYAIGAAFSADGKTFTRSGTAPVLTGADVYPIATGAIVADPDLVIVDGVYHLFFSSFACGGTECETVEAFGVSHATSTDGLAWTVVEAPIRSLLRQSSNLTTGGAQPSIVYDERRCLWEIWSTSDLAGETDDQPVVFNNMKGPWHADSSDGLAWHIDYTRNRDLTWTSSEPGEHLGLLTGADVGDDDTGRLMIFIGFDDQNVPMDFYLPDRTPMGFRPGVMTMNIATRDLP